MLVQPAVSSVPAGETLATLNIKWLANLSVIVMTRMRRMSVVMINVKPSLRQMVVVKLIITLSHSC